MSSKQMSQSRCLHPVCSALRKAPTARDGTERKPVLLHKDGSVEAVRVTPAFGGLLVVSNDVPIVFGVGRWASDAGFPKLRWVDSQNDKDVQPRERL